MVKHNLNSSKLVVALCLTIVLFTLSLFTKPQEVQPTAVETGEGITLQPPTFLKAAHAQDSTQVDFSFLIEEAGITAYTNLNQKLDLTIFEARFKNIRQQTDQFVYGIVTAPGYEKLTEFDETADVQVFLHSDGWIIAYLSRWQTAAEMFDWVNYEKQRLTGTLLENVVRQMALDMGVNDFNIGYYDFRYPEATQIMLVAERVDYEQQEDSFEITIPRELAVYESSWSHAGFTTSYYPATCKLNDQELVAARSLSGGKWVLLTGELVKAKFPPGATHKLVANAGSNHDSILSYCGIAIVYKEAAK